MSRLVVVSNRVPMPRASRPEGGLATAVLAALESRGGLWFGWDGTSSASSDATPKRNRIGAVDFATMPLSKRDYDEYYKGYSNRVLWPLFHMRLDKMEYRRGFEEGYYRVNDLFARKLRPLIGRSDHLWIHDYHLIPLGRALRRAGCQNPLGFFLHVPFPPFDILRALPGHQKLIRSLGAYDLVGFQTDVDLLGFRNSVASSIHGSRVQKTAVLIDERPTRADVFPISIDVEDVASRASKGRSSIQGRRLVDSLRGRRLIIGVDRLDYSKGLTERFRAFERLLVNYPELRQTVIFMQVAPPSRGDVPEYKSMRRELNAVAGEINGRFAEYDWVPIRYLNKGYARTAIVGFLSIAEVGFVTPLRDGMNLVAKEFVAAQDPDSPGVLLLSELAGAARELETAILVNPHDVDGLAEGLHRAISMPLDERKRRWASMMKVLRENDIHQWRRRFVDGLQASAN
ncbi:MAG TPA: trehalose-6-phosphate synthase [Vicinamibacteria bacterium]|nr:trehalose-6-phosphate synthase [Vicinamibacteria bacterium]